MSESTLQNNIKQEVDIVENKIKIEPQDYSTEPLTIITNKPLRREFENGINLEENSMKREEFQDENVTNANEDDVSKKLYECRKCDKKFEDPQQLVTHTKLHKKIECPLCNRTLSCKYSLDLHMNVHILDRKYLCDICGKMVSSKNSLSDHMLTHTTEKAYKCELCDKLFRHKLALVVHARAHSKYKFNCRSCRKFFETSEKLDEHTKMHTEETPFKCKICEKRFSYTGTLATHLKIHTGERHKCGICGREFVQKQALKAHMNIHDVEKRFECEVCDKKFYTNNLLRRHKLSHVSEKSFKCKACGKGFVATSRLKAHKCAAQRQKSKCKVCFCLFDSEDLLRQHQECHKDVVTTIALTCDLCNKKFLTKRNYNIHMHKKHRKANL